MALQASTARATARRLVARRRRHIEKGMVDQAVAWAEDAILHRPADCDAAGHINHVAEMIRQFEVKN